MSRKQIMRVAVAFVCLLALLLVARWPGAQPVLAQGTRVDGRYQLVQGRYVINAKGSSIDESAVFKIDTQTGAVSIYKEGQLQDRQIFSQFEKIPDR